MDTDPDVWQHKATLQQLVGTLASDNRFTFIASRAKYGFSSKDNMYLVSVLYQDVSNSASSPTMMQSKWMTGSAWTLRDNTGDFSADARLVVAKVPQPGNETAIFEVTSGG